MGAESARVHGSRCSDESCLQFYKADRENDGSSLIAKERGRPDFKDRYPRPVELELELKREV